MQWGEFPEDSFNSSNTPFGWAMCMRKSESESRFGSQTFWSAKREAGKGDAELGYFVMDR